MAATQAGMTDRWCPECRTMLPTDHEHPSSVFDGIVDRIEPAKRFSGMTYIAEQDAERLGGQVKDVHALMADGRWRSLRVISEATGHPEASISARLRDLRKAKFGAHEVERRRTAGGLFEYRLPAETP